MALKYFESFSCFPINVEELEMFYHTFTRNVLIQIYEIEAFSCIEILSDRLIKDYFIPLEQYQNTLIYQHFINGHLKFKCVFLPPTQLDPTVHSPSKFLFCGRRNLIFHFNFSIRFLKNLIAKMC